MNLELTTGPLAGVARRAMLLALAIGVGTLAALSWSPDVTNRAYYGFLEYFLDPRAQIANLGTGVSLGFLVGLVHITAI